MVAPSAGSAVFAQPKAPAVGQPAQAQVQARALAQARHRGFQLVQQRRADLARPDHGQRHRLRRQPEAGVRGAQCAGGVFGRHGHRDVAFGRALGDGSDVNPCPRQRAEQPRRHARRAGHAVAHRRQHADAVGQLHALHLARREFTVEGAQQRIARRHRFTAAHHAADGVFGRALGDHHHRDARRMQGREHALGRARHADQAGALQAHQRQPAAEGEAFHRTAGATVEGDARARRLRPERVADLHRHAAGDGRRERLWMDHLGAEVGQFAGLAVAQRRQRHRLGHQPRVGREHAVHVGPDVQLVGLEQGGEDGAGIVAAVASQHRGQAVFAAGDEAGGHHPRRRVRGAPAPEAVAAGRPVHGHAQLLVPHAQHLAGVEQGAVGPSRAQVRPQQPRRPHFAQALDAFERGPARCAEHRRGLQQARELFELGLEPALQVACVVAEQGARGLEVALAQGEQGRAPVACGGGGVGQADQGVGDALHRRHHGHLPGLVGGQQQVGDVAGAPGIGKRAAAELVGTDAQGGRRRGFCFKQRRVHATSGGGRATVQGRVMPARLCRGAGPWVDLLSRQDRPHHREGSGGNGRGGELPGHGPTLPGLRCDCQPWGWHPARQRR